MKTKSKWYIVGGLVGLRWSICGFRIEPAAPAQHFTAKVERGDIHDVVEATGTINAVITVQLDLRSPAPSRTECRLQLPRSTKAMSSH